MARPQKHTAEYFSHDAGASSGRTLSILFNTFGHEGISVWWQLLETISVTENYVIVIRNAEDLEYLAAKVRLKTDRLKELLRKLAELDAIDQTLYGMGAIWCQHFVDRLTPLYARRKQELPTKPQLSSTETPFLLSLTPLIVSEIPHSIVKDSIVKKSKYIGDPKKGYGEFHNVFLSEDEIKKLQEKFNSHLSEKIESMSRWLKAKGKVYKDYYAALLNWDRNGGDNGQRDQSGTTQHRRSIPGQEAGGAFSDIDVSNS